MRRRLLSPRPLPTAGIFLLLGFASALGVAWALALTVDPLLAPSTSASVFDGEAAWSVTRWGRAGASCVVSERQVVKGSWAPRETTGPPNTHQAGDIPTAWAQSQPDAPGEWLELFYAAPVVPEAVHVYETYNPGALIKVSVFRGDGTEVTVWEGRDPTRPGTGMGTSQIPVPVDFPVRRVKLYLDSAGVPGWNEIDAVGLVERGGKGTHWAVRAKASSSYAGGHRAGPTGPVTALLPRWSRLREPGPAFDSGSSDSEARAEAAFGWPMPVVYGQADVPRTAAPAAAATAADAGLVDLSGITFVPGGAVGPSGAGGPGGAPPMPGGAGYPPGAKGSVALSSGALIVAANPPPPAPALTVPRPRRVLWAGWLVNGALYAVALATLYYLLVLPRRFVREVTRVKAGRCIACGYDLGYDFVRGCPECGWRRDRAAAPPVPAPDETDNGSANGDEFAAAAGGSLRGSGGFHQVE